MRRSGVEGYEFCFDGSVVQSSSGSLMGRRTAHPHGPCRLGYQAGRRAHRRGKWFKCVSGPLISPRKCMMGEVTEID